LHFADNTTYDKDDPKRDRLHKIRPLLEYLTLKFQCSYSPSRDVSIDEQLLLHKGNVFFRQYIPSKRARFGIKFFSLCDNTGYLYNTEVYVGKTNVAKELTDQEKAIGKTGQIVMRLMAPILDKGHRLFVDNWYTSVPLFRLLRDRSTPACGTVRKNRAQFPPEFINRKMGQGDYNHVVNVNNAMLGMRYRDKRDVFLLSTFHRPKMVATRKTDRTGNVVMKDHVLADYNLGMGFVDKNDAITTQHTMVRKSNKWTTKVAMHLIEECLFNAHILYGLSGKTAMKYSDFNLAYVNEQLTKIQKVVDLDKPTTTQHYPQKCPIRNQNNKSPTKRSVVCYKNGFQRESRYMCKNCPGNPGLCVDPCFEEHHTRDHTL